jgi:porin
MKSKLLFYALWLTLIFPPAALAEGEAGTNAFTCWATQDYLLGDWGGSRTELSRHGVDFEFFYIGSEPDNLAGGLRTGAIYQGLALATLDLDSQKLLGYTGGKLHVSGLWLQGQEGFSANYSGDYNRVNLVDFPNATRLGELWYSQQFFQNQLSFKVGELSVDSDFIVPEYYAGPGQFTLLNQTFFYPSLPFNLFDPPGFPTTGHGLATMPLAAPGAVIRWSPSEHIYAQAAIYSGTPDQSPSGAQFSVSQPDGALNYFELGWRHNPGTNNPGLGGAYKIGAYYHTSDFADVYDGVLNYYGGMPVAVAQHQGNYGAYLLAEQQLALKDGKADPAQQGLSAFGRLLGAPADRNLTQLEVDAGLVYRGLIPTRNWDTLALAGSYLEFSDQISRAQQYLNALAPGSFTPVDYEGVIELSYKIQATAWWTIQPSVQHVFHPSGSSAIPGATVFILQTTLRF